MLPLGGDRRLPTIPAARGRIPATAATEIRMRPARTPDKCPTCVGFVLALCLFAVSALPAVAAPEAGDVYVAGGDVHTGGPIRGDFGAAGGKVSLDEPVAGT